MSVNMTTEEVDQIITCVFEGLGVDYRTGTMFDQLYHQPVGNSLEQLMIA